MKFYEIMVNLLIGIVGGIFSSIIVSRIFFIQSVCSEQLTRVQEHFERTYGLNGLFLFYLHCVNKDDYPKDKEVKERLNDELLNDIHTISKEECTRFDAMIFDDLEQELHKIAVDLSDYFVMINGKVSVGPEDIVKFQNELFQLQKRFNAYKKRNAKYFKYRILKDKCLQLLLIILIVVIALTIIA